MTVEDQINNIIINENAYFFHNKDERNISKTKIKSLFRSVSSEKNGNFLLNETKIKLENEDIYYSICVFKFNTKPSFINEPMEIWDEEKLAYLIIVEIEDYIVISRRNISKIRKFENLFYPLDYEIISTLFVDDDTSFEKLSLNNLNTSDEAIRSRSVEAPDLRNSYSSVGSSNYIINTFRIRSSGGKISIMVNTGRINKFGNKSNIISFCYWAKAVITRIANHNKRETFLSLFAVPQDYETKREELIPISVLFNFSSIYSDMENNIISYTTVSFKEGQEKRIDLIKKLNQFERLKDIKSSNDKYLIDNTIANDLQIRLNKKTISIFSSKLRAIKLHMAGGNETSLLNYINRENNFIVNFSEIDLQYSRRKLFKNDRLLGNISNFLEIFIPDERLNEVTSEKGSFQSNSIGFEKGSIFHFVEEKFIETYDFFMCDDLGNEWADHIGLTENKISFFHSKYDSSFFSASSFHDIVSQAQKNLGNFTPQNFQLQNKSSFWNQKYSNSNINRIRKSSPNNGIIEQYSSTINNPYLTKELYLIINFISKDSLETNLLNLKDGSNFRYKNVTIQILWLISSLISSCSELDTKVFIYCKP